jgi:hypothetical protein
LLSGLFSIFSGQLATIEPSLAEQQRPSQIKDTAVTSKGKLENNNKKEGTTTMKISRFPMIYETPMNIDILRAYINKNGASTNADARKIRRALRKLAFVR